MSPSPVARRAIALIDAGDPPEALALLRDAMPEHAGAIALLANGFPDYARHILLDVHPAPLPTAEEAAA